MKGQTLPDEFVELVYSLGKVYAEYIKGKTIDEANLMDFKISSEISVFFSSMRILNGINK